MKLPRPGSGAQLPQSNVESVSAYVIVFDYSTIPEPTKSGLPSQSDRKHIAHKHALLDRSIKESAPQDAALADQLQFETVNQFSNKDKKSTATVHCTIPTFTGSLGDQIPKVTLAAVSFRFQRIR